MSTNSDHVIKLNYAVDDFFYTIAKDDVTNNPTKGKCSTLSTMSIDCANPSDSATTWQRCDNSNYAKTKNTQIG